MGASDGEFLSNSLHFEEKGWYVLCVEPNPLLEVDGRSKRKLWRAVGASDQDGERQFSIAGDKPWASHCGFHIEMSGMPSGASIRVFIVQCLRLDRILEESGFPRLDYLTIDAQWHEPQILAGLTLERWKPTIVVVEDVSGDTTPTLAGYEKIHRSEVDTVFRRL